MSSLVAMMTATRGRGGRDWTDWLAYAYLVLGVVLMFGPVVWLVLSSFKSAAALTEFPPRLLPYGQATVTVPGHADPLPLFNAQLPDGQKRELAELRRIGIVATMIDPNASASANFTSRPRTTPTFSASSTSAASCGTASSSRSSPPRSRY